MDYAIDYSIDQTVEIKARCRDQASVRSRLDELGAVFRWEHAQSDIFFNARQGRLKLRHCGDSSYLIAYSRPDTAGPKNALVELCPVHNHDALERVLSAAFGVRSVVRKHRTLYTHGNTRIHLDRVETLGDFVEIEVLGKRGQDSAESLQAVCEGWIENLGLQPRDLVKVAYADLLEMDSSL